MKSGICVPNPGEYIHIGVCHKIQKYVGEHFQVSTFSCRTCALYFHNGNDLLILYLSNLQEIHCRLQDKYKYNQKTRQATHINFTHTSGTKVISGNTGTFKVLPKPLSPPKFKNIKQLLQSLNINFNLKFHTNQIKFWDIFSINRNCDLEMEIAEICTVQGAFVLNI